MKTNIQQEIVGKGNYLIPYGYFERLLLFTTEHGLSLEHALKDTNISLNEALNKSTLVGSESYDQVLKNLLTVTHSGDIVIKYANRMSQQPVGLLGQGIRHSATLKASMLLYAEHLACQSGFLHKAVVNKEKEKLALVFTSQSNIPELARFHTLTNLLSFIFTARRAIKAKEKTENIELAFPPFEQGFPYEQLPKGINIHFNCSKNALLYPIPLTNKALISSNPKVIATVLKKVSREYNTPFSDNNISEKVKWLLRRQLPIIPNSAELAGMLNMSISTMKRHLKAQNTSYCVLKILIRDQYAIQQLLETSNSTEQIAQLLGFENAGNFAKAFKASQKLTPNEYRNRNKLQYLNNG